MDNIRRPVPVAVPMQVSLSNEEVDRIVLARLREIAHGIDTTYSRKGELKIEYQGYFTPNATSEVEIMSLLNVRDSPRLHELYVSYLAYRLESALRMGPLKTPDKSKSGMLDY